MTIDEQIAVQVGHLANLENRLYRVERDVGYSSRTQEKMKRQYEEHGTIGYVRITGKLQVFLYDRKNKLKTTIDAANVQYKQFTSGNVDSYKRYIDLYAAAKSLREECENLIEEITFTKRKRSELVSKIEQCERKIEALKTQKEQEEDEGDDPEET